MKYTGIIFTGDSIQGILEGRKTQTRRVVKFQTAPDGFTAEFRKCPYGQPGARLWVRESHARIPGNAFARVHYFADGPMPSLDDRHDAGLLKKYSPRFMPRWASRITLELLSVRIERVQDITEEDAQAEGCADSFEHSQDCDNDDCALAGGPEDCAGVVVSAKDYYAMLWDTLNAKRGFGWDANPFVWRLEFKRLRD